MTNEKQIQTCYWFLEINSGKNRNGFQLSKLDIVSLTDSGIHLLSDSVSYFFLLLTEFLWKHILPKTQEFVITFLNTTSISYLSDGKYRVGSSRAVMSYSDRLIEISSTENFNFPMPIIEFMIHQTPKKKTFESV